MRPILAAAILATATPCAAQELTPGTVTVEPPAGGITPEAGQLFVEAAATALADAGFTPLPGAGGARYSARLMLTRAEKGAVATCEGNAGGSGNRPTPVLGNWGAALLVPLGRNGPQVRALIVTELAIALIPRGATAPAWEGRALTTSTAGTAGDAPAAIAPKLARAALGGFPHGQGAAVSVP